MNPLEEYLENNKDKKFSIKTLKNKLNMKGRSIIYYYHQSKNIRHVEPSEVGCGKSILSVYTFK